MDSLFEKNTSSRKIIYSLIIALLIPIQFVCSKDLYQQVITEPDPTALCDCVARILRFLRHSDPSVCISNVDESLDYFVAEKRTTYRIAVQNTRNGRLVGELDAPSRARLLENLIESVYDEQPDFTFASSAGFTSTAAPGRSGHRPEDAAKPGFSDQPNDSEDILPEDVNVLIKAGQDANGCSYYYMDGMTSIVSF
ncbi:unnamed protein product [Dibothriocephalus latus]|uniref:Uncharacterized protein n=1 Tax=Dibothriocephalus latus TaxID=60516 RepID=A0A3P7M1B2_DIBLA|nr:unnamed protein product [Dibothriocephalus latus]